MLLYHIVFFDVPFSPQPKLGHIILNWGETRQIYLGGPSQPICANVYYIVIDIDVIRPSYYIRVVVTKCRESAAKTIGHASCSCGSASGRAATLQERRRRNWKRRRDDNVG